VTHPHVAKVSLLVIGVFREIPLAVTLSVLYHALHDTDFDDEPVQF
jgi:hypothetical protein